MNRCSTNNFKKLVHKTAQTTGEFMGKKSLTKFYSQKLSKAETLRNVTEVIIPPKKGEILDALRQVLQNGTL